MEYLTEIEKVKIETFCKDEDMLEAVKKVLLQCIYSQGVITKGEKHNPFKNRAFALIASNPDSKELGDNVKAWFEGVNALEEGFKDLSKVKSKKNEPVLSTINEAI